MFSADQLLTPISADQPSGTDLSFSSELDAINQARRFDDPSLDQGEWLTDLKEADWDFVIKRCVALLEKTSKDLRLAVWLAEAGAKKHRLRGLGEGFLVLAGLLDQFWDRGLYPESDGADHDQRIGNLSWILARTPALLREIPVTDGNGSAYSTIDFESARKNPNGAGPKLADMEAARRANSAAFRAAFNDDARYCLEALQKLEHAADARLGADSPGFSNARETVQTMLLLMPAPAPAATPAAAPEAHAHAAPGEHFYAAPDMPPPAPGKLHSRGQAIAQLRAVADFFRRTEPHSPVSYFADKAADAGEQDLHSWLRTVVKDQGSLAHIEELLGVKPAES
ncbi:MAG: type VI secretion system protein TssA [Massilia sp.]